MVGSTSLTAPLVWAVVAMAAEPAPPELEPAPPSTALLLPADPDAPGPEGSPLDVVPVPPLDGVWGYGAEVVAAIGVQQAMSVLGVVPLAGPVLFAVLGPHYTVDAIRHVAGRYTITGERDPFPALVVAYVSHSLQGLLMLGAQVVIAAQLTGLGLVLTGENRGDGPLVEAGLVVLSSAGVAAVALAVLTPVALVATMGGPHLEVLAYRLLGEIEGEEKETDGGGPEEVHDEQFPL